MVNAVWNEIAKGKVDALYLLTGVEHHIFDKTIERLKKAIPGVDDENIVRYDLEQTSIDIVLEEADTLPFLQDHKLIIANDAYFLTGQDRKKNDVVHDMQALERWLDNPSPTATLVIIAPYEKLDGRKKITKKLKAKATVIEANRLEGKDLNVWVQNEAQSNQVFVTSESAQKLIETVGENLLTLSNEITKMATYLDGEGEITVELIEQMVPRTPELDVFRLTDAFVSNRISETITIYHDLLRVGEEPIMLTSLIASQVRLMIHVQSLMKKGYHQQQIAKTLRIHPYRVKLMQQNKRIPSNEVLVQILEDLAEIDFKLKSTSGKRERLLELFFMSGLQRI